MIYGYNKYNYGDFSFIIIAPIRDFYKKVGEIMAVYKDPHPTKDGRCWYFKIGYKDVFENNKQFRSKRFMTKKEAQDAERTFLITSTDKVEDNNMTFLDLYKDFRAHNDEIMIPLFMVMRTKKNLLNAFIISKLRTLILCIMNNGKKILIN